MFDLEPKRKLWAHQREAFEKAKDSNNFGFFFEVGAGKTLACITTLRYKYFVHKQLLNTLILGPPIIIENWRRELIAASLIDNKSIVPLVGSGKERLALIQKNRETPKIYITNYETLLMKEVFEMLDSMKIPVIVFDELHKLKDMQAKRTKAAIKLADNSIYRYGLTGTPVLNSALDLFAQFRCMDLGETFGKNFFSFRAKYFYDKNAGMPMGKHFPDWRPRSSTYDELNAMIYKRAMRVEKDDCLDLPPLVKKQVFIEMTTAQKRIYDQMKKAFIAYINDKAAVAELAITKALRLQQIVTGFVKMDDESIHRFEDNPRRKALKELLEDLTPSHKVIVWAVFKENYNDIREVCGELKINYVEVHGEVSDSDKRSNVDTFNTSDSCRVFIGHPLSGGIGISLIPSDVMIFYSRNFSLEQDIQAEARCYRGGSEVHSKVTRIDLVAPNTIDEQVLDALINKVSISESILRSIVNEN